MSVRVYTGTKFEGEDDVTGHPCAWLDIRVRFEPEGRDLRNALGSRYFRYYSTDTDEMPENLPTELSQAQIVQVYREEIAYWGTANLGTWVDQLFWSEAFTVRVLEKLDGWVGDAFPAMWPHL
jgi:hypothetical protein